MGLTTNYSFIMIKLEIGFEISDLKAGGIKWCLIQKIIRP